MLLPFALSALLANAALSPAAAAGKLAYQTRCASCHGEDLRGGVNAPSLRGVGAADLDFWMVTGRMPAALPWLEVGHRGPQIGQREIESIEAYVTSIAPGGPPIPEVATGGNIVHGRELFAQNCEHCHGIDGTGASLGDGVWAPALQAASITQLDYPALGDLATYVSSLDTDAATAAFPLRSSGPVPEGLYGWLGIGALCLCAYAYSKRRKSSGATPPKEE
jgi:ubiquinol-cytochrome c reductase cytochrome c subunit